MFNIFQGAKINKRPLTDEELEHIRTVQDEKEDKTAKMSYVVQLEELFISPCMRKRLLIQFNQWIAVVLAYNGLTLNNVNLVSGGTKHDHRQVNPHKNWGEKAKNGKKWQNVAKNGKKWQKMAKNGKK